jgi:hypothetical protein
MADQIQYAVKWTIHKGKLDEFKALAAEATHSGSTTRFTSVSGTAKCSAGPAVSVSLGHLGQSRRVVVVDGVASLRLRCGH